MILRGSRIRGRIRWNAQLTRGPECPAAFADLVSGHDRLAFAFDGGAGQEKSLFADGVFHWVTVTVPPPVSGARRQFFFACASVLAPGLQSGRR